jgi:hypothetical protein
MPAISGESEDERSRRGKYFGVLRRIERNNEFFKEVFRVEPQVMALFGAGTEDIFCELHEARRQMEVSAGLLFQHFREEREKQLAEDTKGLRQRQLEDIDWAEASGADKGDRIGAKLAAFRERMEKLCRPIVERGYRE